MLYEDSVEQQVCYSSGFHSGSMASRLRQLLAYQRRAEGRTFIFDNISKTVSNKVFLKSHVIYILNIFFQFLKHVSVDWDAGLDESHPDYDAPFLVDEKGTRHQLKNLSILINKNYTFW